MEINVFERTINWLEEKADYADIKMGESTSNSLLMKDELPLNTVSILVMERMGGHIPVRNYTDLELYVSSLQLVIVA